MSAQSESSSVDVARRPYSRPKQVAMISLVMWVLFVISGPITGPQATFGVIASRGLFSSKCIGANVTACAEQEQAIESATVLCLSLSNFLCVGWGFAQDVIGARKVAVISVALWIAAKSCAGFYPDDGIVWTVSQSVAASAGLGAYSAIGLEHLRQACVTDGLYAVMGFISSAAWDIAVILNLALAQLYGLEAITLWEAYMIYGLGAGVPVLAGLALWPKSPPQPAKDATEDCVSSVSSSPVANPAYGHPQHLHSPLVAPTRPPRRGDPPAPFTIGEAVSYGAIDDGNSAACHATDSDDGKGERLVVEGTEHHGDAAVVPDGSSTVSDVKQIFSTAIFWIFAAHCSVVVTVGYFMIANVGSLATSHGMHDRSAARDITTVMMSAIGVTSIVPGRILYALGTQRGLVVLMAIQAVLLIVFGALIAFGDETTFYISFGLMFIWRVWGFGMTFPFIDWRFKHCPNGVGVCYGGVFALGGAVSMAAGSAASHSLHTNPQASLRPVMLTLCGVAVFVELVFGFLIARVDSSNVAGVEIDEATAGLIIDREA